MTILLLAAISVDGKIAQHQQQTSLDWTSKEDKRFFSEKTKEIGVLIMGRKTFETIGKPLKGRRLVVMSSSEQLAVGSGQGRADSGQGTVEFTNEQPRDLITRLKKEGHDAVVVAGGASIYSLFLREHLINELYLTIEPVMFGEGIPLASDFGRLDLILKETIHLNDSTVVLHYKLRSPA